jgi:hypothetical protein
MKSENLVTRKVRTKLAHVGIGGWNCPCCYPEAEKGKVNKLIRTQLKRELKKEIEDLHNSDEIDHPHDCHECKSFSNCSL